MKSAALLDSLFRESEAMRVDSPPSKPAARRSFWRVLAVNLGTAIVLWLCVEAIAGLFVEDQSATLSRIQFANMTSRGFVEADDHRGFRLRTNFRSATLNTNSQGFRGKELPAEIADKRLVLALGESTTFGWAVGDEESYPSHLERILNATSDDPVVVVNAGIPSYSSQQVLLYAEELLQRYRPTVVLVSILWNDLFYSSLEDWTPESLVPPYPSQWQSAMFKYSRVYRWLASRPRRRQLDYYSPEALVEYRSNIARMIALCRSHGVPVVFVEPPFCEQLIEGSGVAIWEDRFSKGFVPKLADMFLEAQVQETESRQVPLTRHELGVSARPTAEQFLDFLHPDSQGNQVMAQSIARVLQENDLLAAPR